MDEREWLACNDPTPMLALLTRRRDRRQARKRKLTLFACACCRRIWHLIPTQACRRAVEVSEQYADGRVTELQRAAAYSAAFASAEEEGIQLDDSDLLYWGKVPGAFAFQAATGAASDVLAADAVALDAAEEVIWDAKRMRSGWETEQVAEHEARATEQHSQSLLVRDLIGNPFRSVAFDPAWRRPAVLSLAQAAYDNRSLPSGRLEPEQLVVLADALEETGCDNAELLSHLRGQGPHVRGCWAVDLLLAKE